MIHTFEKGVSYGADQNMGGKFGTAPDWVKEVPCQTTTSAGRRRKTRKSKRRARKTRRRNK